MSGPIPQSVAEAAGRHASEAATLATLRTEAAKRGLSIGRTIGMIEREKMAERERVGDTPGGAIWRGWSHQARTLLVMHAAQDYEGDPRNAALMPWKSFSESDQASIGAMARELAREFKEAAYLR